MRSAARNSRSVIGSVEQRASTSPLADVRYSGRPRRRSGKTMSTMKFAVCSIPSTASRSPPSEILGTVAVAALPSGFARRSSILFVPWAVDDRRLKIAEDDTDQLALRRAEPSDDALHAFVDVEAHRQNRDEAIGDIEQLAVIGANGHCRSVEYHEIVVASRTRLRDRSEGGVGPADNRQDRNSVRGLDRAGSFVADTVPG